MATLLFSISKIQSHAENFTLIFSWLEEAGLSFINPSLGSTTKWNDHGEQVGTTRDKVFEELVSCLPGSVQLWHGVGDDLFLSWSATEIVIFFDALRDSQRLEDLQTLIRRFVTSELQEALGWKLCLNFEN